MSASRVGAVLAALTLALALAHAGEAPDDVGVGAFPGAAPPAPVGDLRDAVRGGLHAQHAVAARTLATVAAKRDVAATARAARVRAAYRVLRERTDLGGTAASWLVRARRRAGAGLLLADDRREVRLLAEEAARLASATTRLGSDVARAQALPPPVAALRWPVDGATVARGFGPFVHEASRASLSRRGVDLEVAERAVAGAPAAGIVRYAGPIRGLDHGVVLDHDGLITVVAKLGALDVARGDAVTAGQPLGRAARRRVYVEARLPLAPGGTPVPPAELVAAP